MNVPRRRPLVGPLLVGVGAVHTAITPLVHPASVRSILDAGVVDAVARDPALADERGLGFWFATTGLGLMALGWAVTQLERSAAPLPRALPVVLIALSGWGVLLLPRSPFWVLGALGVLAEVRRRRT